MDKMYLYWNVLGIFYLQEFVVWFSCNKSFCPSLCSIAQNHKQKHTKRISFGHFNEIKLHVKLSIYA